MSYWIVIWLTIVTEENLLFNRGRGYDWSAWNNRQKLPVGVAAGIAFLVGWVGAVIGMVSSCPTYILADQQVVLTLFQ